MNTAIISDLHLTQDCEHTAALFLHFLNKLTDNISQLYILGDLFEQWIGDDDHSAFNQRIIDALAQINQRGITVYIMHGNRDFLLGKQFATQTRCQLLNDPSVINLYSTNALLCHGDTLCTDDVGYQRYRQWVHHPTIQRWFLRLPLRLRRMIGNYARKQSQRQQLNKPLPIMDANQKAIQMILSQHHIELLIHGHTHRPNLHYFQLEQKGVIRIVLSDWSSQGNVLLCTPDGHKKLCYFDLMSSSLRI